MKNQLLLVLVLLFSLAAQSLFALEVYDIQDGSQVVVLPEDDHWSVDTFSLSEDGWPDKTSHEEFSTREEVQSKLDDLAIAPIEVASSGKQPVSLAKKHFPKSNAELKGRSPSTESLWPITSEWNLDWEKKYTAWIESDFNADFFLKINFPTACSDVAYALRWIFARNNGLPAANRLSSGAWFTNRSLRDNWRKLATDKNWFNDKRFLAALNYLAENTYTHTLWDDSYTIKIVQGPMALEPGAYHVNLDGGYGHTMIVYKVSSDPNEIPLLTLSSTTPRAVRKLNEFVYSEVKSKIKPLALFRMRWPIIKGNSISLVPAEQMPGYSNEQNDPNFVQAPRARFWEEVFYRLNPNLDFGIVVKELRAEIRDAFLRRVDVVQKGLIACKGGKCKKGTAGWEDWSTVSFDERLNINIVVANEFMAKVSNPQILNAALNEPLLTIEGHAVTFGEAMDRWSKYLYMADPAETVAHRWGFDLPPPAPPLKKPLSKKTAPSKKKRKKT